MYFKLILLIVTIVTTLFCPQKALAQAPNLGTTVNFVLFTSNGAVGNSGVSHYTGNVGAKIGAITGFGNVNGQIHAGDAEANQAATDLLTAYGQLNAAVPDSTLPAVIGNGSTLPAGTYYIPQPGTLNATLNLDAKGNPNAVFIFQVNGTFSSNTSAKIKLLNGAQSCKVFWKVEGAVTLSVGTSMKGTIVANNGAITMNTNDTLDGRALSTTGAILMSGVTGNTPIGCGSVVLNGPTAPALASTACYTIFSGNGSIINTAISNVTGDIGSNTGSATGFDSLLVIGKIHKSPDVSTATCSSDLNVVFNYLSTLPHDIELQSPALFGRDLVLTPHTYLLNSAAILTDTLYLDAQNNPDGVFVIKIVGALSTSTYARVKLLNGAQPKNIYWNVVGAVSINDYSIFCGTIVCSGAINLNIGSVLNGRALTTGGAVNTVAITAVAPPGCSAPCPIITSEPVFKTLCLGGSASFSVVASGDALTYQWRRGTTNLTNGARISGAMTATLTISPVIAADSALNYNVVVSGSCPAGDTSAFVALNVNTPPVITSEPANQAVCLGSSASFTTVATGTNLVYKWKKGTIDLSNSGSISGVSSSTLVINPTVLGDAATNYNVVITGTCAPSDTSAFASLSFSSAVANAGAITGTSPVCQGQSGVVYSVPTITNAINYLWTLPAGASITTGDSSRTITVSFSASAVSGNITVKGSNGCGVGLISAPFAVVVNSLPGTPGIVSGTTPVCQNQSGYTYSVALVGNATSYVWTLPSGATITSGATTNSITVSFSASAVNGNISVQAINSCGTGAASALYPVTVSPLPSTGTISGPISVCQNQGGYIYTVPAIANANSYLWTVPNGATITSGAVTNSITVSFNGTALNGNVTVQGVNSCGNGPVSAPLAVVVSSSGAGNAGAISGPSSVCQGQSGVVYSVPLITNAVTYTWILPAGATITSGNNTNSITVSFSASAAAGNITVQGGNSCGNGLVSANFPITISTLPSIPGNINGTSPVCQGMTGIVYNVPVIANATSYLWTVPSGAIITSGSTTNSITVDFSGAAISGNITVQGVNSCGNGPASSAFAITVNPLPGAAGAINGSISACKSQTNVVYTIPPISNASSYSWTVPSGATITSGATTNSITVSFSASAVSGNITVQGVNACGSGLISTNFIVIVSSAAAGNAGAITGKSVVCQGETGVVYTVPVITDAVIYTWILPVGATITGGVNTNSITVSFSNNAQSGNISVQGSNGCGTGLVSANFPVVVNVLPAAADPITGPAIVCQNQSGNIYTVPTILNALSYEWTVPSGATITSASNGRSITVDFSGTSISGNVTAVGVNACGKGSIATYAVTVNQTPTVNTVGNQILCANNQTGAINFSGTATNFNWTNNNTSIGLAASGSGSINSFTAVNTGNVSAAAIITVTAVNNVCPDTQTSFTITVNAVPIASAGGSSPVCTGDTVRLTAQTVSGATYNWTGPNGFSSTDQNPVITGATVGMSGNYSLVVLANNCPSVASIVAVVVNNCGGVDVSVVKTVNNTQPVVGQTVVFTLIASNNGTVNATGVVVTDLLKSGYTFVSSSSANFNAATGIWTIGTLAAGTSQTLLITLRVNASGDYVNTASITSNEADGDVINNSSVAVTFPTFFKIPAGFSPNGDGTNDQFVITGISSYPSNNLTVFNRWGDRVYEMDSYNNTWNGDSNKGLRVGSNELPMGTYFYVFNPGDGSDVYKGTIYISK